MIISHKHKFIFIKTEKTAGTSIEIALSKYLGPNDIITRISPEDEQIRKDLGFRGPQNYHIPWSHYLKSDFLNLLKDRKRAQFFNHCSAKFIHNHINEKQWNEYYKFCFERNPFTKVVSWYQWLNRSKEKQPISSFLKSPQAFRARGLNLYTIDSHVVVDEIYKFEELNSVMEEIANKVGLPEIPTLTKTKPSSSKNSNEKNKILLSEADIDLISKVYAREIIQFGYKKPVNT
jgi:hypothetical protein